MRWWVLRGAMLTFLSLSHVAVSSPSDAPFRAELWRSITPIYQAILKHPFLLELQAGRLRRQSFQFYLIQDLQYLHAFSSALEHAAAKAPRPDWAEVLRRHARGAAESEAQLHQTILRNYGITQDRIRSAKMAPTNFAYTNFLVATACSRPFPETLAALAPCYWIYLEVGKELKKKGSLDKTYQLWIDTYSSPGYERDVEEFLSILDASAPSASDEQRSRMRENFDRASRYEWMFWDMAYRMESWPAMTGRRAAARSEKSRSSSTTKDTEMTEQRPNQTESRVSDGCTQDACAQEEKGPAAANLRGLSVERR